MNLHFYKFIPFKLGWGVEGCWLAVVPSEHILCHPTINSGVSLQWCLSLLRKILSYQMSAKNWTHVLCKSKCSYPYPLSPSPTVCNFKHPLLSSQNHTFLVSFCSTCYSSFICTCVCECVYMPHECRSPQRTEEDIGSPGAKVTGGC